MGGPAAHSISSLIAQFRTKRKAPAVGAALLTTHGETRIECAGTRRRDQEAPALPDDCWHIGSCGKSITAALFARLVERGAADWNTPLADFFPDLAKQIHPSWRDRTIDEALVCRSGMRGNLTRLEMAAAWRSRAPLAEQRTQAALSAFAEPAGPRGRFVYSNLGYIVVAAAIDRLCGAPFEAVLTDHVFRPLGATSYGFGPPPSVWGHKSRVQIGGLVLGRGAPVDPADPHSDNPEVMNSAGRLHLTLSDWARFIRVFLTSGEDFLRAKTISHMLKVPKGRGSPMAMGWAKTESLRGVSYGMQGSNTMWSATALINQPRTQAALVVCNDGRTGVLQATAELAAEILISE